MLTLLLIEPHAALRRSLQQWLETELSGGTVLAVSEPAQALKLAAVEPPCVMLIDLDMIEPTELTCVLRLGQFCGCAIIGVGLDDTTAHRQRAQLMGIPNFVGKAQLQTDLIPLIHHLLDRTTLA